MRTMDRVTNKKIFIYGDYDVDGVTSTVILYKSLKALGANVFYYIPNRVTDGYGLNVNAIERLKITAKYFLFITDYPLLPEFPKQTQNDHSLIP